jgi:FkbM family methyltransferase
MDMYGTIKAFGKFIPKSQRFDRVRKQIKDFIISCIKSDTAQVQGHKMFLDSKDSLNLSINGVYEPLETEIVKQEIKKGDVVLDLGANIGYYTLIFAQLVGEEGRVFAFEPDDTNFNLLKRNVEINGYKNVTLVQKAVSHQTERVKLYLHEENKGMHNIYEPDSPDSPAIEIETVSLDDFLESYTEKIDFIKMDIEGSELDAIEGMSSILQKSKNVKLMVEFFPLGIKRLGLSPEQLLDRLVEHRFKLYHINKQTKRKEPIHAAKLLKIYDTPEMKNKHSNLLCKREGDGELSL